MITNTKYKPNDKTNMDLNKYKRYHDFKQTSNKFLERVYNDILKNENPMP
jgi:CTP synthase (UTP-ammonia lyase)